MTAGARVRRALIATAALFALGSPLCAAPSLFESPVTAANRAEVYRACTGMTGGKVMRGNFAQRKEIKSLARKFSGYGTFVISSDNGIIWNTQKPFPSTMIVTGSKVVQVSAQGKASALDAGENPVFAEFAATIRAVFSGSPEALFARFDVYFVPPSGADGDWKIGLIPKDRVIRSVVASMVLTGTAHLDHFYMEEPSGDTVQYDFTAQTFSGGLTDDEQKQFSR